MCALVMTALSAAAQKPTRSQSKSDTRIHFQASIDALTEKWHITIVAESSPIIQKPGVDTTASLPGETVSQAVTRIADAFDYTVKSRDSIYILNKRFTVADDLPDLTLKEASAALKDLEIILQPVDPKFPIKQTA